MGHTVSVEPRRHFESAGQGPKSNTSADRNVRRGGYARSGVTGNSFMPEFIYNFVYISPAIFFFTNIF